MDNPNGDMQTIKRQIVSLNFDMNNLHQKASEATIRRLAKEVYDEEGKRLDKLRSDAVSVLNLLIKAGVITREELNEATGPR